MMTLGQIARVMNGRLRGADGAIEVGGVSTDTRGRITGRLFVALRGPRFDGHRFAEEAVRKGAAAVVCDSELPAEQIDRPIEDVAVWDWEVTAEPPQREGFTWLSV